jgi:SAM-dependent methyltransferase
VIDPLEGSPWSAAGTVAGFSQSPPNEVLMRFAAAQLDGTRRGRAVDIGCGAARNGVPLAQQGWRVLGTDYSWPMLEAARERARAQAVRLELALAPMEHLPVATASADLVIAHGIWNLSRSAAEFRAGVAEAARIAAPGAGLFVFTFSRHTLAPDAEPVAGETFVFTQFSGQPQVFLTAAQLLEEMRAAGFEADDRVPLTEYNRPPAGALRMGGPPVIYEAAFLKVS